MPALRLTTLVRRMRRELPPDGNSDADLLARFAQVRDASAFELLVWRHGSMVLGVCRRILRHAEDAEDAFQAVFLILARKAGTISRGTALPAWLHRVAVRVSTRHARSRRMNVALQEVAGPDSPDSAEASETLRALDEEIDRLTAHYREAVVLCYLEGLTAAEAAQRLGCPTGTVESRLASARRRLRERLARRGITLSSALLTALSPALAPEAVAHAVRLAALFARGDVVLSEASVRLAQGVLDMWRTRTWAALATMALVALTATASFAWPEDAKPEQSPVALADSVQPQPAPKPQDEPKPQPRFADPDARTADAWAKPVWVASTVARIYDISADGKRFLISDRHKFGVFDRDSGKTVWMIDNTTIHDAKFSPDGATVAAGEWEKGLNFYEAETGKKLFGVPAGEERPWQVFYRPDGTLLYHTSASRGSTAPPWTTKYSIIHYDPAAKKERGNISRSITYSTTNPWLWHRGAGFYMEHHQIFGTDKTTQRIVNYTDPITGKTTPTIDLHVDDIPLDLSPDGKTLLVMTAGEQPRLVDTTTGKTKFTLGDHKRYATDGAFSPDGKLVATVTGTDMIHSTRGAYFPNKTPAGPAELVVWDTATGKAVSRAEFPTKELDFVQVRFSPNSKFLVATSREGSNGKSRAIYAFGTVPFDKTGGVALNLPGDEALKPKPPPARTTGGTVVGDPLDRLIDDLAKSNKSVAGKVDALFLAALGRFATASEQKRAKDRYGDRLSTEQLRGLLNEIAATPEFDAHLKSLETRLPPKPALPFWPGGPVPPFGQPFQPFGLQSFGDPTLQPSPKKP